jgi:hypothetical protein
MMAFERAVKSVAERVVMKECLSSVWLMALAIVSVSKGGERTKPSASYIWTKVTFEAVHLLLQEIFLDTPVGL